MTIEQTTRRTSIWGVLAIASMLSFGACADVDDQTDELTEDSELEEDQTLAAVAPGTDLGKGNGRDVVVIGDSWMTMYGGGLQGALETANGRTSTYRKFGVPGTTVLSGQIPNQFERAVRQDRNISTVVMTGGGNDVLLNPLATAQCRDPSCPTLKNITAALVRLWNRMAQAGVKNVVYVGYSEGAGNSPAVVTNATKNGVGAACQAMTTLRCHVIDSTPIVRGRLLDGIHPTGAAHRDLAGAVLRLMEQNGIRR